MNIFCKVSCDVAFKNAKKLHIWEWFKPSFVTWSNMLHDSDYLFAFDGVNPAIDFDLITVERLRTRATCRSFFLLMCLNDVQREVLKKYRNQHITIYVHLLPFSRL